MQIGFSTGALFKFCTIKEALILYKKHNIRIIEINALKLDLTSKKSLADITKEDLDYFDYVSFHAPKFDYQDNQATRSILTQIEKINQLHKLDLVVFHPDIVRDYNIFNNISLPIAFENMDIKKTSFQTAEELLKIVDNTNFRIVLDVNHLYTNNQEMSQAPLFFELLGDKIAQYHISGYVDMHEPLYKTKQRNILERIENKPHPAIIESIITPDEIGAEYKYVKNILG